ncbi:hypothetical protein PBOI14_30840 [Pseudomonas sp. Boi14]|nr:hypothetical protein PBOI14_30840 [Pseudomonas sp. Boi14]
MSRQTFDYIIIGAGSAGCVLANRLSEDPGTSVLVLEFGGSDRSVLIQMPSAFSMPMNTSKYNWRYQTEPEPYLDGRRIHCPRGKVLGARPRSTAWSTSAATPMTSMSGKPWGAGLGLSALPAVFQAGGRLRGRR